MICRHTPTHGWVCGWLGWSVGQSWTNRDNSILFEDLWFVETPQPMIGCVGSWVDAWFSGSMGGSFQITKNLINLDLIEIILFEDLWFVKVPPPMGVFIDAWVGGWVVSGQFTKNVLNLDIMDIIQFWLNIYDLWRHPYLCVGWVCGLMCGVRSNH